MRQICITFIRMTATEKEENVSTLDEESGQGCISVSIDVEAEKSCVRKLYLVLLQFLTFVSHPPC